MDCRLRLPKRRDRHRILDWGTAPKALGARAMSPWRCLGLSYLQPHLSSPGRSRCKRTDYWQFCCKTSELSGKSPGESCTCSTHTGARPESQPPRPWAPRAEPSPPFEVDGVTEMHRNAGTVTPGGSHIDGPSLPWGKRAPTPTSSGTPRSPLNLSLQRRKMNL